MRLSSELLKLLVCPITKGELIYDREAQELISVGAKLAYQVTDTGIPILLEEQSRALSSEEITRYMKSSVDGKIA